MVLSNDDQLMPPVSKMPELRAGLMPSLPKSRTQRLIASPRSEDVADVQRTFAMNPNPLDPKPLDPKPFTVNEIDEDFALPRRAVDDW